MDLVSLYYFSELAKDLHMTRTASRLFISQQTLSNHIKRLEDSLGVELFTRKPNLRLTYAGESVLAFANRVGSEYANLKDTLSDITGQERGLLRFGASSLRLNTCLPRILPEFSARYPNVELRLTEANSPQLEPLVLSGDLDFAVVLSGSENPNLICRPLINEQIYLCVADSLLTEHYGPRSQELKDRAVLGASVEDFAALPFSLFSNRLGRRILECFEAAHITPKTYATSTGTRISLSMCAQRSAACFAAQMRLVQQRDSLPEDINIFPFYADGQPLTQPLELIYRKDRYLSRYSQVFLELLTRYFSSLEQLHLIRKV